MFIMGVRKGLKDPGKTAFFQAHNICAIHCAQLVHNSCKNISLQESARLARICTNLHVCNIVYILFNYLEKLCTTNQFFRKLEKRAKLFRKIEFSILSVTHVLLLLLLLGA